MTLVYVDDIMCISHDPKATMQGIQASFKLKDNKIEKPENYLGAQLFQRSVDGRECWNMASEQYALKAASTVNVVEALDKSGQRLPSKATTPMPSGYRPEMDATVEFKSVGDAILSRIDQGPLMGC
jgi:hypothetical protein